MDLRRLAARGLAAVAVTSAVVALPQTWGDLADQRTRYGAMSDAEAEAWPATYHDLDADAFDFFARWLDRDSRYYVHAPSGRPVGFFDEAGVARTWAAFRLLPALQVDEPQRADRVLAYHANVRELRILYASTAYRDDSSVGVIRR